MCRPVPEGAPVLQQPRGREQESGLCHPLPHHEIQLQQRQRKHTHMHTHTNLIFVISVIQGCGHGTTQQSFCKENNKKKATCCVKACRLNCSCVQFSCTALPPLQSPLLLSRNVFLRAYFERATQEFPLKDASLGRREEETCRRLSLTARPPCFVFSLQTGECARACARHATGKNVEGCGGGGREARMIKWDQLHHVRRWSRDGGKF